ncbi:MAG: glycosyltransferase family 39 protein [Candidatus Thermoplasmatota archaeon]|nr:glycosyltransferase family 39 protein [Candidatus Thermoplasmatota archaeon]
MRDRAGRLLRREGLMLGAISVLLGTIYRIVTSLVFFLQADEEIFAYDSYYFILGESFDFIVRKIGAYLGYPFLLSLWFRVFGVSMVWGRLFSVLCSSVFLLFVFLTIRKVSNDARSAMLGTLLLALLPFPLRYGHIILTEPLVWAVLSAGLYLLVRGVKEDRWGLLFFSGMICAVAFFIRRSALILPFVVVPSLLWVHREYFGKMVKGSLSWISGFLMPFAGGIAGFMIYFGWDRLQEIRWTRIPNITPEWTIDLQGLSSYEYALYTLQPTIWKGTFLVMLVMIGGLVMLMSLFRDRWKAVYAAAFLWPAFMRVAFDMHMGGLDLARMMVIPSIVLFSDRTIRKDHRFFLALSILIGSTVGFSSVRLSGDIWNVVIYLSAAGLVLLYLSDRLQSRMLSSILMAGGLISLYLITFKEPQIAELVRFSLPVITMVYGMSLVLAREVPDELPLTVVGAFVPMVFLYPGIPVWAMMVGALAVVLGIVPLIMGREHFRWSRTRFAYPLISVLSVFFIPNGMPLWGIYLPFIGMVLFMLPTFIRSHFMTSISRVIPVTGTFLAFCLAFYSTGSLTMSLLAAVIIGSASAFLKHLEPTSMMWRENVGEKISVVLLMLVVGYLAFYVYYAWTEVYMTEFLFPAVVIGGLLLWTLGKVRPGKDEGSSSERFVSRILSRRSGRGTSALFLAFLILSVPVSVGIYLDDDWFREEAMDKRPYMRTIIEVASWIEDNSEEGDVILAWHCYAIEADRETVIEVSNARIYNAYTVVDDMEDGNVSLFVRDWYTDHGIWQDQKVFQEYILENFVIDRVIDGNECWIRVT